MKPSLQLKFSQQLTMTPQLQQAIKLLQMSSQELEGQILEALETNPLLEREEVLREQEEQTNGDKESDSADTDRDRSMDDTAKESTSGSDDLADNASDIDWDMNSSAPMSAASGATGPKRNYDGNDDRELADGAEEDLVDHLLWQLNLARLSATDVSIGVAIIEAINDDGYLTESLDEIRKSLAPDINADIDEIEAVRHRIQRFDPIGAGSLTLSECLALQLDFTSRDEPGFEVAMRIVENHLGALGQQDVASLKRNLRVSMDELETAIRLVRSLDPKPGAQITGGHTDYIRPDVIVEKRQDRWTVRLHGDLVPRVGINNTYANMIGSAGKADADYLRGHLQEARWLIKSLETRNETLYKVASAIVEHQHEFLDRGPEGMKPLVLREIAETIDMHESTVSRVTTRKFMLTPRGVFELKYFFSSHVGTADGGECSATAIQAKIKKLIDEESRKKPLSDAKLASMLNESGIDVARRTVAKYREALNIPSSTQRKRLI